MQLHRVAFDDVGELPWKYHSPEQLVRAMCMALVAHRDLYSLGISHRDISPENILIRLSPDTDIEKTQEGLTLLTDSESASLPRFEWEFDHEGPKTAPSGDDMTNLLAQQGTVAFTFPASCLLQDIQSAKLREVVSRTAEQDIESFAWVFVFVVYKRALEDPNVTLKQNEWISLKEEFDRLFPAGQSAEHVLAARSQMTTPTANQHVTAHIRNHRDVGARDDHFCALVNCVWTVLMNHLPVEPMEDEFVVRALKKSPTLLAQLQTRSSPPPLTHSDILGLFDAYLELVEEARGK